MSMGTELFNDKYPEYAKYRNLVICCTDNLISYGYKELAEYNKTHCFPALIAKELGWELENDSKNGSGNELIAYRTLLNLTRLLESHPPEEIVALINWTDISRRFTINKSNFINYCPPYEALGYALPHEQHYYRHISTHFEHEIITGTLIYYNAINSVVNFCRNKGIKLLMTVSLSYHSFQHDQALYDTINRSFDSPYWWELYEKYIDLSDLYLYQAKPHTNLHELISAQIGGSFASFTHSNGYPFSPYGHPATLAHDKWAEVIVKELKDRGLV